MLRHRWTTQYTRAEAMLEAVSILGLILGIAIAVLYWQDLPVRVPSHFDFRGRPDAYASRSSLVAMPAVAFLLYALLTAIKLASPRIASTAEHPSPARESVGWSLIAWIKAEMVWLFVGLECQTIRIALGEASTLGPFVTWGMLLLIFGTVAVHITRNLRTRI